MATKICKGCGIEKDLEEFHNSSTNKLGRHPYCKECRNWNHRSEKSKQKELELKELQSKGLKRCACCREIKPITEFPNSKNRSDGLHPYCFVCSRSKGLNYSRSTDGTKKRLEYMFTDGYLNRLKVRYHKKMDTKPEFKTATYLRNQLYNGITGWKSVV